MNKHLYIFINQLIYMRTNVVEWYRQGIELAETCSLDKENIEESIMALYTMFCYDEMRFGRVSPEMDAVCLLFEEAAKKYGFHFDV